MVGELPAYTTGVLYSKGRKDQLTGMILNSPTALIKRWSSFIEELMEEIQKSLGLKIQALRKAQNMTQEDLAEKVGVSWRTISNLETGRTVPKLELIYDLSQYFNIGMDELLNNRIQTSKTITRLKLENEVTEGIKTLNDNLLRHIKEYMLLLKKDFDSKT